jgi:hypothetical protein
LYNKLNFVQSLVESDEFRHGLVLDLSLLYDWTLGVDGCPTPFCKMNVVDSLIDVVKSLEKFSNQELAIMAEFFTHCTRNSASNIKQYFDLVSQIINRNKKDMFSLRGWKSSYYIHLMPLRDLSTSRDCIMVFGELVDIPPHCIVNKPFKFPEKYFGKRARSFWLAHPSYGIRDTRFKSFTYGIPKQDVFFSFYAAKPIYEKFLSMLDPPLDCHSGEIDMPAFEDDEVETKDNKQVADFNIKLPPMGYGNNLAKHETNKQSLYSINRQIATSGDAKTQKWEHDKKLKTLATKFFG